MHTIESKRIVRIIQHRYNESETYGDAVLLADVLAGAVDSTLAEAGGSKLK